MALAHFRMLIQELLNKDPDIVPEESPLIILDIKYDICIATNGKDANNTSHIPTGVHSVSDGERCKMQNIYWREGGLKLADIAIKNVSDNDLNDIMKKILVKEGDRIQDSM